MYLISLKSTHHAMMLEHLIKTRAIKALTIPTPRAVSNSCGMSIKLQEEADLQELINIVEQNKLLVVGIFEVGDKTLNRVYTNLEA